MMVITTTFGFHYTIVCPSYSVIPWAMDNIVSLEATPHIATLYVVSPLIVARGSLFFLGGGVRGRG